MQRLQASSAPSRNTRTVTAELIDVNGFIRATGYGRAVP